jgi:poly(hydroxyalkanoate) depolymerase family esterase
MPYLTDALSHLLRLLRQWAQLLGDLTAWDRIVQSTPTRLQEGRDFGSNPGNLRMFTYVPDPLPNSAALVVVLHGCTQTAVGYDHGAGWSTLADRYAFALLFPEQQPSNNLGRCFNWFQPEDSARDHGEALSIRQMIERMAADHDIDRSRIFVTGLSAGGAMACALLAAYPEVFAAGGVIAGLPAGAAANLQEALDAMFKGRSRSGKAWGDLVRAASPHPGPWPRISVWHGDADGTVKPSNATEIVRQWADLHGIAGRPALESKGPGFTRHVWRDRAGREVIESFTSPAWRTVRRLQLETERGASGSPVPTSSTSGSPRPSTSRGSSGSSTRFRPPPRGSDCVCGQAVCHGLLSRMMALRMVRSFRATATRATILGFPAWTKRSRKALSSGL